ncbi:MAG: Swt1 family HEPN domain-containing protein [Candidatus Paceibacterota bacterium]
MAKTLYNPKLLEKLAKKLGKSEQYVREQISKRAKGYSPVAYFVYWLTTEGIRSTVYQRSLSNSIKSEIQSLLQNNQKPTATTSNTKQKIQRAEKTFKIKALSIKAKSPLLEHQVVKEAHESAETYQALFIFENSVRNFIIKVLEKKHGKNWWNVNGVVNGEIKQKVQQRQQDEKINSFHGKRGVHDIFYTDFSELATIIKNNAGTFNSLFSGMKGKTSFLTQKLEELAMSRNNLAHTCPLKKKDRDRFLLYFQDWYDQLDTINTRL